MSLTAASGLAQHKYYTRTVRRLAREHDEPGCMLVSGRGKGRVRGAIAVLVLDRQDEVIRAAAVMEGATVLARFKERPDWVGLCRPRRPAAVLAAPGQGGRRRPDTRTRPAALRPDPRDAPARTTPHRQDELLTSPDCRTTAISECAAAAVHSFQARKTTYPGRLI